MDAVTIKDVGGAVRVGFSGKALGNTNDKFGAGGEQNFAKFKAAFDGKIIYDMPAVGGDQIIEVDGQMPTQVWAQEGDALITKNKDAVLTLRAADCIPLVFFVPGQPVLALAHVGSPGAALHLPRKVVEHLGIEPAKLHVYFGPSISQKSYRFEPDKFEKKLDASWDEYISHEPDGIHLDLQGYVKDELKSCGITDENMVFEDADTHDEDFFSHRRHRLTGEPTGRNAFAVHLL